MAFARAFLQAMLALLVLTGVEAAAQMPPELPRYDLDIRLDRAQHTVFVRQRVTWTNRHALPATELVFNVHSHYQLPDKEVGMTAKMYEILRVMPMDTLDDYGHACDIRRARLLHMDAAAPPPASPSPARPSSPDSGEALPRPRRLPEDDREDEPLPSPRRLPAAGKSEPLPLPRRLPVEPCELRFHYQEKSDTALVIPLPRPVRQGECVTIEMEFALYLPPKQGRWGEWEGVTFLTNWLPVLAYFDDKGWQPTPYVVWHQPFFNEAGIYTVSLTVPCDQKVACTAAALAEHDLGDGQKRIDYLPCAARDFSLVASARFQEYTGEINGIRVRVLAFPEHEYYARKVVEFAREALDAFTRWFGPYPYPQFTVVESFFGWHSNECSGLIMLDSRIFGMPHVAWGLVDYLVAHETCHQWWYNVVGTNGYCETWMDEGVATYFAYRLMGQKYGKNDPLVRYPKGLQWMPNVRRDDYRYWGLYGTLGRGEAAPTIQEIPKFGHLVDLWSMCYDRGGKIVGMIESRLPPGTFLPFMQRLYRRYYYRILRVADFQRELEVYSGASWEEFFKNWLYGKGLTDWSVAKVDVECSKGWWYDGVCAMKKALSLGRATPPAEPPRYLVTVLLEQKADYNDPTVLGISLDGTENYRIRIPIVPHAGVLDLPSIPARVESLAPNRVRVTVELPSKPTQIAVDPDEVLVDADPINNYWKSRYNIRFSPFYTFLEETDLTNSYDRWNLIFGPWLFAPTYDNPFFTRSTRFGVRAGAYRTAQFEGGVYSAYRTDYRDFVTGVDAIWDHFPWNHTEVGLVFERRLAGTLSGEDQANRGVLYGRYVIDYGDSLYLPPFQYVEAFTTVQDNLLPTARETVDGAERYQHQAMGGAHYHINYLTPYWDAEGGFQMDVSWASGLVVPGIHEGIRGSQQVMGQIAWVNSVPDGLGWLSTTRFAFRAYGAIGIPSRVQYFPLGGGEMFRGFDLAQRQGSAVWIGSIEWRVPIARHLCWDFCDRAIGVRNIYGAAFWDVGAAYLSRETVGGNIAQCVGAGLRIDVAWFTFMERTILRLDAAKTLNDQTRMQYWIGIEHPF